MVAAPLAATAAPTAPTREAPLAAAVLDHGDDMVAVPGVSPQPAPVTGDNARAAAVVHTVWISAATLTTTTADDVNATAASQAKAKTLVSRMNSYWSVESSGKVSIVFGGFETRSLVGVSSCESPTLFNDAATRAFGGAFANYAWIGTNKHLITLPLEDCGGGLGSVGGDGGVIISANGVEGDYALGTALHEFGHNLGFGHADAAICNNTTSYDGRTSDFVLGGSVCPSDEYGDTLDIMGATYPNAIPHLSTPQRVWAGYLSGSASVATVSGAFAAQTVTVKPLDTTSGIRALVITDPVNGDAYYVEYRTAVGNDASAAEFQYSIPNDPWCLSPNAGYSRCYFDTPTSTGGVRILRLVNYDGINDTAVMAAATTSVAPTDKTTRHMHLRAGDSFISLSKGFTISITSASATQGAAIKISPKPSATTTTLALSNTTRQYANPTATTAIASVAKVNGSFPAGTVTFRDGSTVVGTKELNTKTGQAGMSLSPSLSVGTHTISANFVPSAGTYAASTSASKSLTVTKATSSSSITLRSTAIKVDTTSKVTVTVTVPGVSQPTGTITAYSGNKVLATYTLSAASAGVQVITLPKFTTTGGKTISIRYGGTTKIVGSTSPSKLLTVVK
jgi:hypothetical protein